MAGRPGLPLAYHTGGHYDFLPTAMPSRRLSDDAFSRHISDHFPLWVEFATR